ncbi:MAG: hypothetical protein HOW97_34010 [Catenulispora sp.]|nr:hypothetical protein [Catenulispora sp.]
MTGRPQVVVAVLRVVAEPSPAAYYACLICPFTAQEKATSRRDVEKVAAFAADIRTRHRAECPTLHPERTAA